MCRCLSRNHESDIRLIAEAMRENSKAMSEAVALAVQQHSGELIKASGRSDRLSWIAIGVAIGSAFVSTDATIVFSFLLFLRFCVDFP